MILQNGIYVMVYGTLREGGGNHAFLESAVRLQNLELAGFRMVSLGAFPAVHPASEANTIQTELYEVDANTFAQLDQLEGYPSFYDRKQIAVELDNGARLSAWLYIMAAEKLVSRPALTGGDWLAHQVAAHQ